MLNFFLTWVDNIYLIIEVLDLLERTLTFSKCVSFWLDEAKQLLEIIVVRFQDFYILQTSANDRANFIKTSCMFTPCHNRKYKRWLLRPHCCSNPVRNRHSLKWQRFKLNCYWTHVNISNGKQFWILVFVKTCGSGDFTIFENTPR